MSNKILKKFKVGGMPIVNEFIERMKLKEILSGYLTSNANEKHSAVESLILLIHNLILGKSPVYELEEWIATLDPRCIGYDKSPTCFNDDRFGRALDKLQAADRASIMAKLVVHVVKEFRIDLEQIHNDSTSVKACGKYPAKSKSGFELKHGVSKDHRHDLKQLVYNLSISADGAVPIHQKTYCGNRTDDTTHIETWNYLCLIAGRKDFLYVADSKLCTENQLGHIVGQHGRAITIMPRTWGEHNNFMDELRKNSHKKVEIWRRSKPGGLHGQLEYFSKFKGKHYSKSGYRIHWISSSGKREIDLNFREKQLIKVNAEFEHLVMKLNKRKLKTRESIEAAAHKILKGYNASNFYKFNVVAIKKVSRKQIKRGRPGEKTAYKVIETETYSLTWGTNKKALRKEKRTDGVFPLLSTDKNLSAKEVIKAYKYQPMLEKRFSQFKSCHKAAPLLFKKIERIEANMFAFFIALLIQALIEREVRLKMKETGLSSISVYPEDREASRPTTAKIMDVFEDISTYKLYCKGESTEEFKDDLNKVQKLILRLLNIEEIVYWGKRR